MPVCVFTSIFQQTEQRLWNSFIQSVSHSVNETSWTDLFLVAVNVILWTPCPPPSGKGSFVWTDGNAASRLKTHHGSLTKQSPWNRRRWTRASSSGRRPGWKQDRGAGGWVYSAWDRGFESERSHEWDGTGFPPEPIDGEKPRESNPTMHYLCNTYYMWPWTTKHVSILGNWDLYIMKAE